MREDLPYYLRNAVFQYFLKCSIFSKQDCKEHSNDGDDAPIFGPAERRPGRRRFSSPPQNRLDLLQKRRHHGASRDFAVGSLKSADDSASTLESAEKSFHKR
ncbi:hypothetical protein QR680_002341 [Steinernema hermaphroditum]|uniref:Uncharacterized protein n=1 Tax=Steinernema hermaphroditum TaxID=289476 RepID=A0AA39LHY1_9BILA|nr:hypothetical protein QR680_002341 [Steinernema hermaphroditum]